MLASLLASAMILTSPHATPAKAYPPKHHPKPPATHTICFQNPWTHRVVCTNLPNRVIVPICKPHQKSHKNKPCTTYHRPYDRVLPSGMVVIG